MMSAAYGDIIQGLMNNQRFEVSRVRTWHDGSQSLWVIARPKSQKTTREPPSPHERGPYCSLRFRLELQTANPIYQYDPSQTGDTDEDI